MYFPCKPYPILDQNGQNLYPFLDQNGAKPLPGGVVHTYIAYIGEYPLERIGGCGIRGLLREKNHSITHKQRHIVYNNSL